MLLAPSALRVRRRDDPEMGGEDAFERHALGMVIDVSYFYR